MFQILFSTLSITVSFGLVFALFVIPKEFGLAYTFTTLTIIVVLVTIGSKVFADFNEEWVRRFLDIDKKRDITYGRIMSCIGEILVATSILAIGVGYSYQVENEVFRIALALCITLLVIVIISFSVTSLLLQCFDAGKDLHKLSAQMLVGVMLILFSQAAVDFGVFSGKGVAEYYICHNVDVEKCNQQQ